MCGVFSPGSAKAEVRWNGNKKTYLTASCVGNNSVKSIKIAWSFFWPYIVPQIDSAYYINTSKGYLINGHILLKDV